MKPSPRSLFLILPFLLALPGDVSGADGQRLATGLKVSEFPRHAKQKSEDVFFLPLEEWGKPIGKPRVTKSLAPWQWNRERNAIAEGFVRIDRDGDYEFTTRSFYDRNLLMIDGKVICEYRDGDNEVVTVPLKKGMAKIVSAGFVGSRGSCEIRWRPPGQAEFSPIPGRLLKHESSKRKSSNQKKESDLRARSITIVAKDFVLEVYRNGKRVPDKNRELLLDRFGATAERVQTKVRAGDWLVFQVAHNRLRHGGTKYFAMAGATEEALYSLVSDPESPDWSYCDDPELAREFIRNRDFGTGTRALPIEKPWEEGAKFMKQYAGDQFPGGALWGAGPSTWLKLVVPEAEANPIPVKVSPITIELEALTQDGVVVIDG